jgi:hypothetical protein
MLVTELATAGTTQPTRSVVPSAPTVCSAAYLALSMVTTACLLRQIGGRDRRTTPRGWRSLSARLYTGLEALLLPVGETAVVAPSDPLAYLRLALES